MDFLHFNELSDDPDNLCRQRHFFRVVVVVYDPPNSAVLFLLGFCENAHGHYRQTDI